MMLFDERHKAVLFSVILSQCIRLSMYVCQQDLLVRLCCQPRQTKNSVPYCL